MNNQEGRVNKVTDIQVDTTKKLIENSRFSRKATDQRMEVAKAQVAATANCDKAEAEAQRARQDALKDAEAAQQCKRDYTSLKK